MPCLEEVRWGSAATGGRAKVFWGEECMGDNGCEGLISRVEVGTAGSGWGSVSGTSTLGVQVVGGARNRGGASFAEGR